MKIEIKQFCEMVKENEQYEEQECDYCNPVPIRYFSQDHKEYDKKWVSVESIHKDYLEIYARLSRIIESGEGVPPITALELGKLKHSVVAVLKELEND